jgi:hypothetical protein
MPELQGIIDRPTSLRLAERGWEVIPCGRAKRLGKLFVIHGDQVRAGMYSAKKMLELYPGSVLAGHTHSAQSFSKVTPYEVQDTHCAWTSPVLCSLNPGYLRNAPTAWVNGFTVVEVRQGGNFNVFPIVVTNGRFAYGGEVFGKGK